jgi:hypothetical protein
VPTGKPSIRLSYLIICALVNLHFFNGGTLTAQYGCTQIMNMGKTAV